MGVGEIIFVSIIAPIIVAIVLFFILPFFKKPRGKFTVWIQKKPKIQTRKEKDIFNLQLINSLLKYINDFFRYTISDREISEIKEMLKGIKLTVNPIKYRKFRKLKQKIINFSEKINSIYEGISAEEMKELFVGGENSTNELITEIDNIINPIIKKRFKNISFGRKK